VVAVHRHLARSPSRLFVVRLEDLAGERAPVNLPGTIDEYPNWRLRLPVPIDDLPDLPLWGQVISAVREERPRR
jgi:4-alpha-glucanotransferase